MYKYVLFDLDGTLANTSPGVFKATDYMIDKLKLRPLTMDEKRSILGPPLWLSFNKFWGIEGKELEDAIELYREFYVSKGFTQNDPYPGNEELLSKLQKEGFILLVATSKPNHATPQVLDSLGYTKYFTYVACPAPENESTDKSVLIIEALTNAGCKNYSEAIMIGDRKFDILGARKAGVDSIGITYGFGSVEELKEAGATYICNSTKEIENIMRTK